MVGAVVCDGPQQEFLHFAPPLTRYDDGCSVHVLGPLADGVPHGVRIQF